MLDVDTAPETLMPSCERRVLPLLLLVIGFLAFLPLVNVVAVKTGIVSPSRLSQPLALQKPQAHMPAFNRALLNDPGAIEQFYRIAHKLDHQREFAAAAAGYTKVIEIYPRRPDAYFNRGICFMHMKRYDLALADFSKALVLDPNDADLYKLRANVYDQLGNGQLADADRRAAQSLGTHNKFR